jgi:hypothetical protein
VIVVMFVPMSSVFCSRAARALAGLVLIVLAVLCGPAPAANAATITVTSAGDDVTNDVPITLREAIQSLNQGSPVNGGVTSTGGGYGTNDTINFNIAGAGVHTISFLLAMDPLIVPMTINGYTQGVASMNTLANGDNAVILIELNGAGAGIGSAGLNIAAPSVTILGLAINRFDAAAINIGGANAQNDTIVGNFLGTDPTGTTSLPNGVNGITITQGSNMTIGTAALADRNLISGNTRDGIELQAVSAPNARIQNNFIGTNAAGTGALGNGFNGVHTDGQRDVLVGGTTSGTRNVIAGNLRAGILVENAGGGLTGANALVQGNFIGVGSDGVAALGNDIGVQIDGAPNATIGGTTAGAGNLIANNTHQGVRIDGGTGNAIRANAIYANGGVAIDLNNDGVTPNDTGDPDTGPNDLQNFPLLTSAAVVSGATRVSGTLNSTASTTFLVDLYSTPACDTPSNQGEGQNYLGTVGTSTNGSGDASFVTTGLPSVAAGSVVTAVATSLTGNTSEFSACQSLVAPAVLVAPTTLSVTEGGATRSFTVRLTAVPTSPVTVTLSFDASKVSLSSSTVTFNADASAVNSQTVTVTAVDNGIVDGTRTAPITFAVTSSDTAYTGAAAGPVTATVTDNDGTATLTVADVTVAEPDTSVSATSTATLTVTLSPPSTQTITVQYATANGTARSGPACASGVDYLPTSGTLTFNPGDTSKTITVTVCGDAEAETSETLTVALTNPTGGAAPGAHSTATVTISDSTIVGCSPRPRVLTRTSTGGSGLQVAVEPTPLNTGQNNRISALRFDRLQNARVTVNGQAITAGQTVNVPSNSVEQDFTVTRTTPGQATTVFFTVIDSCGEAPSFVGGGTAAGF